MLGIDRQNAGRGKQIQAFLESSDEVEFKAGNKEDLCECVN
jgi:hypothetical protein